MLGGCAAVRMVDRHGGLALWLGAAPAGRRRSGPYPVTCPLFPVPSHSTACAVSTNAATGALGTLDCCGGLTYITCPSGCTVATISTSSSVR